MLDTFFTQIKVRSRMESGPIGPYLSEIAAMLHRNGYAARMATLTPIYLLRSKPYKSGCCRPSRSEIQTQRRAVDIPCFALIKIKCGVNSPQIHSQSTFIQLTPHFTVLDIWKGFVTNKPYMRIP
jgi:hypothetical protein